MGINNHDAYRQKASQNVAYNGSVGASTQSTAFGSQTYAIRVCTAGVVSATIDGVRIAVGDNPTATATSALIPVQWVEYIKCSPGQKVAVLGNNTGTGVVNVTELTD